ncbi:MAG: hypothetical protein H7296_16040 [Bacteroidia bacterium]|nr:hypothetical protein [Bacteroidia bacterium]
MKIIKPLILGFALTALVFNACKKDEVKTTSKTDLLTAKDWKITAATMTSSSGTVDIYALLPACNKDDLSKYNTDHTITDKAGATKCDQSEPSTSPGGNWSFINNESGLRIIDKDTTDASIITLTSSTLKISTVENSSGTAQTINVTFTAQ